MEGSFDPNRTPPIVVSTIVGATMKLTRAYRWGRTLIRAITTKVAGVLEFVVNK